MTPQEYHEIIKPIKEKFPNLCIFGMFPVVPHHQTFHIEIESSIYAEQFQKTLDALAYLLPKYTHPEGLRLIVHHMKRRHDKYFSIGVVLAACIHKGCKIDDKTKYSDVSIGDDYDCLIIPPQCQNKKGNDNEQY